MCKRCCLFLFLVFYNLAPINYRNSNNFLLLFIWFVSLHLYSYFFLCRQYPLSAFLFFSLSLPPSSLPLYTIYYSIYINTHIHTLVCSRCCYQCRILCQKILYTVRVPSNLLLLLSGLADGWGPFICAKGIAVRAKSLSPASAPTSCWLHPLCTMWYITSLLNILYAVRVCLRLCRADSQESKTQEAQTRHKQQKLELTSVWAGGLDVDQWVVGRRDCDVCKGAREIVYF